MCVYSKSYIRGALYSGTIYLGADYTGSLVSSTVGKFGSVWPSNLRENYRNWFQSNDSTVWSLFTTSCQHF